MGCDVVLTPAVGQQLFYSTVCYRRGMSVLDQSRELYRKETERRLRRG